MPWAAAPGILVPLPLIVDIIHIDPTSMTETWRIEATVSLVDDEPRLCHLDLSASEGLDIATLQRDFRFATPLDIVRRTIPTLIARGEDPFAHEYATIGYPSSAELRHRSSRRLSDEFLEDIARKYLELGRGSARVIAVDRGVSQRTVIGWIEKARRRKILSPIAKGSYGGTIIPAGDR